MITRLLPLVWMILFFAVGVVWRAWLQYRRYGNVGIILYRATNWSQRIRDTMFVLLSVSAILQTMVFAVSPQSLSALFIASLPAWLTWMGVALLFGGLALMVAAQLGMGVSWRVGIDEKASPGLVTGGLYQLCRNPIYLGMFTSLAGLMAVLPTWLSLAILLVVFLSIRSQVFKEEEYLIKTYGNEYGEYAARIGRFLPRMGKLRLGRDRACSSETLHPFRQDLGDDSLGRWEDVFRGRARFRDG
jgi:protein-S-isoprenylcysteine O-methyltransferase Ste14